ncbi:Sporulation-specific N-acetylmuramoyl-L-alanine amidase [Anoxybacillus thermarum]|uniref:Sporulation-specific N-acetylmuramoyl-L-alanine amidase n=1 Tax=Anoxybacillus thermarum TaxID=404937 RepID=A0A0D0QWQ9_9BACL|nr:N-acetylmuramoyl-L-alanine amidase [Anoxybacillus thermarum]KIQ93899.1 Sporulation-specific N-acetylmuramoyl-L-alanine amidase [Anoxybacillus thermarum]
MVRIVIDFGHGGSDPGAVANGLREKDLTMQIGLMIGDMLSDYEGVEVIYTRSDDRYLSLEERAAIANKAGADFFLSIHINAGGGTGFESYIHNGNVSAKTLAYQNVIHAEIMKAIGGVKDRGKKRANYAVLRESKMPALLTENLFIDNASDAAKLKSQEFILKIASGHVEGIVKAFGLKKKKEAVKMPEQAKTQYDKEVDAAFEFLKQHGVVTQDRRNEPVTRAQMFLMLYRFAKNVLK